MGTSLEKKQKLAAAFKKGRKAETKYQTATEMMSIDQKLQVLNEMGRPELIDLFKEWKPRVSKRRQRGAPLDQRVSITVTDIERTSLDAELRTIKSSGNGISMSQFIRNRALASVDIEMWRQIAEKALKEIEETAKNQVSLRREKSSLILAADEEDDPVEAGYLIKKADEITRRLNKIVAQNEKRKNRLTGRMSMPEAEQIKWRAQRLCISSSDYLRMMIFGLTPDSIGDSHMSLDAKRRFYISIVDVSNNGWGSPPTIYQCSQCENYMEKIRELSAEVEQLRRFA